MIRLIPGFEFVAPGTSNQFDTLFRATYKNANPTYFRLSDYTNKIQCQVTFGKANIIKKGSKATVIAVSTMLDIVMDACADENVTILYYTTLVPFDDETLRVNCPSNKVLLCEPHYSGALVADVVEALQPSYVAISYVGIPNVIIRSYGTKVEKDMSLGLTSKNILKKLKALIAL
jgi:transketolase